jgi:hypothetical protein
MLILNIHFIFNYHNDIHETHLSELWAFHIKPLNSDSTYSETAYVYIIKASKIYSTALVYTYNTLSVVESTEDTLVM